MLICRCTYAPCMFAALPSGSYVREVEEHACGMRPHNMIWAVKFTPALRKLLLPLHHLGVAMLHGLLAPCHTYIHTSCISLSGIDRPSDLGRVILADAFRQIATL